jgi:transposase
VNKASYHHLCRACDNAYKHPAAPVDTTTSLSPDSDPSSSPFDRDSSSHTRLTIEQRWTIITLHRDGQERDVIANKIPCTLNTVSHWINHYNHSGTVAEKPRSGRRKKTDENTDINIVVTAAVEKFTRPKKIKRELDLSVSARTVRRRLDEAGLFGRIARKEYPFTTVHIQKRLSFATGYGNWTVQQWGTVLFSDETHVELGERKAQVWVQRPVGTAFDPEYMNHKVSHPQRVSAWGCFSASGVGDIAIFTEMLDAKNLTETSPRVCSSSISFRTMVAAVGQ